jgi:hypothetical protein
MKGRHFLELTVASDPDATADVLKGLVGVTGIRRKERLLLVEHDATLSSADIIEACVKQGIRIEEVKRGSASLEEIFMPASQ